MTTRYPMFAALFLTLFACVDDVGTGKVTATVEEVPSGEPAAPEAAGETWRVDASRSTLGALGAKVTAKHPIAFSDWTGEVTVAGDDVTALAFEAKVAALKSDNEKLDKHLVGEDFLWAEKHP